MLQFGRLFQPFIFLTRYKLIRGSSQRPLLDSIGISFKVKRLIKDNAAKFKFFFVSAKLFYMSCNMYMAIFAKNIAN